MKSWNEQKGNIGERERERERERESCRHSNIAESIAKQLSLTLLAYSYEKVNILMKTFFSHETIMRILWDFYLEFLRENIIYPAKIRGKS